MTPVAIARNKQNTTSRLLSVPASSPNGASLQFSRPAVKLLLVAAIALSLVDVRHGRIAQIDI